MRAAPRVFVFRLAGTTFVEGYPATLARTVEMLDSGPVPARFHRVPTNEVDPNAVAVVCVAAGGRIGWLPAPLAARVAPALDTGTRYAVEVIEAVQHPNAPHNPGLNVRAEQKEFQDADR